MPKIKADYRSLKAELEAVIGELQQDGTDIDAALAGYERGLKLITELETYLTSAENRLVKMQTETAD